MNKPIAMDDVEVVDKEIVDSIESIIYSGVSSGHSCKTIATVAIDALKKQGYVKLDDLIEKCDISIKEHIDSNEGGQIIEMFVHEWLTEQQKAI